MIPPEFIDELLSRTDIVEIVDARVKLKKTGQNYSGLCPFHNEKTPSFSVSSDKQFYYCFGCQASGSALKFVMEFDRLDFIPAVEYLAGRLGLEVPQTGRRESPERQLKRKSIYEVLEQAASFYALQLKQGETRDIAVNYLKARGLSGEIARDFGLGFAPSGWDNLQSALAKTNHERQLLIDSGMLIEKEDGENTYDRFRERIMFPIRDVRGRVIAFGGRILGDGKPKYLNSPETEVFHKGRELYGLYEARQRNKKLDHLLVVEGYMDVVALAQHGISNAVATLGTATTGEHLERIFRLVSKVVFCFDGDQAGKNAAWKALNVALPHMRDGRSARFLFVPDGEDPDSLVREEGADKLRERIDSAPHLSDFFFSKLSQDVDTDSLDGKAHLSQLAMPLINQIPVGVFRELMVGKLSEVTNLSSEKLYSLATIQQPKRVAPAPQSQITRGSETSVGPPVDEIPDYGPEDYSHDEYGDLIDDDYVEGAFSAPQVPASPLVNKAISILLSQPEVCTYLQEDVVKMVAEDPGSRLLHELVQFVLEENLMTPMLLLLKFQQRPEFAQLKTLAESEQLLPPEGLAEEFVGTVEKLAQSGELQNRQDQRRRLLAKPWSELTDEEKSLLKELSRRA